MSDTTPEPPVKKWTEELCGRIDTFSRQLYTLHLHGASTAAAVAALRMWDRRLSETLKSTIADDYALPFEDIKPSDDLATSVAERASFLEALRVDLTQHPTHYYERRPFAKAVKGFEWRRIAGEVISRLSPAVAGGIVIAVALCLLFVAAWVRLGGPLQQRILGSGPSSIPTSTSTSEAPTASADASSSAANDSANQPELAKPAQTGISTDGGSDLAGPLAPQSAVPRADESGTTVKPTGTRTASALERVEHKTSTIDTFLGLRRGMTLHEVGQRFGECKPTPTHVSCGDFVQLDISPATEMVVEARVAIGHLSDVARARELDPANLQPLGRQSDVFAKPMFKTTFPPPQYGSSRFRPESDVEVILYWDDRNVPICKAVGVRWLP